MDIHIVAISQDDPMTRKTNVKASPEPTLPPSPELHSAAQTAEQPAEHPAGNASQPMAKQRVRIKAQADQTTIQEEGADALPVSDYPLKHGPLAANAIDLQQRSRLRVKRA